MATSDSSYARFVAVDQFIGVPHAMSVSGTSQLFPLGLTVTAVDQNWLTSKTAASMTVSTLGAAWFVYVRGSDVLSRGQFVHLVNNSAVLLNSDNSASFYPIGLAAAPLSATNAYGWVQIKGLADYATCSNSDVAAQARFYFGSTAGQVGTSNYTTDTVSGWRIQGLVPPVSYTAARTASGPNLTVYLDYPVIAIGATASN